MSKFEIQLGACRKAAKIIADQLDSGTSYEAVDYKFLYDELCTLKDLMPDSLSMYRNSLDKIIIPNIKLNDIVQQKPYGQKVVIQRRGVNPYVFGQTLSTLHYISESLDSHEGSFWKRIHPSIVEASRKLFENQHYAESVEAAFLELSVRVKNILKSHGIVDLDGTAAMQRAFSVNNPIIQVADTSTRTGKDIQQVVMELFCGSIRYIRNPKAHEKIVMDENEAISKLHLASMLMSEIDKAGE